MERHPPHKLNSQIYSEASEWFVECRSGTLDEAMRRRFDRWLRKSPEHLNAYLELAAIWNEGPTLDPRNRWDADTLIAQATQGRDNVISLSPPANVATAPSVLTSGARRLRWVVSVSAAMTVLVAVVFWSLLLRTQTYSTAVGEQRSIALEDGSTIELNSRSRVRVNYSEGERALELIEGQALFRVAKDAARPFIVTSGDTRVRAVGTQFDVNRKRSGTVVTVVEGHVAVLTEAAEPQLQRPAMELPSMSPPKLPTGSHPGIMLAAGEQITVAERAPREVVHPNIAQAIAWRQRQLVFDRASLAEVIDEFNRYNERRLVVIESELYDFHISGVFSSTDPGSLLRFLSERTGMQVVETDSEIRLIKKPREEVTDL